DLRQLLEARRLRLGDLVEHPVVEDDERRNTVGARALEPPRAQALAERRPARSRRAPRRRSRSRAELLHERARRARPADPEDPLRARQADVEQPPLLGELVGRARLARRQLLRLEPRQKDGLELETLRAVEREQVDAARAVAARVEPAAEVVDERARVAGEAVGERDEPREVGLAHELALAERVVRLLEPTGGDRGGTDDVARGLCPGVGEARKQAPGSVAREQRRALERDAGVVQQLLVVGEPRVRAAEDGSLLKWAVELPQRGDDRRGLLGRRREPAH